MNKILLILAGIVIGGAGAWFWKGKKVKELEGEIEKLEKEKEGEQKCLIESSGFEDYNRRLTEIKEERKRKILDIFEEHETPTNNIISDAIDVSRTTVFRYMNELENEGKVSQVGKIGRGVHYVKTGK